MGNEKNNKLCNQIRSVKSWLTRAEDSFGNENDVQGEINLLLAEAEMQYLRELDEKAAQKRQRFLSIGVAVVIAAIFVGAWKIYLPVESSDKSATDNLKINNNIVLDKPKEQTEILTIKQETKEPPVQAVFVSTDDVRYKKQVKAFDEDEMRTLVRTAGKVLRN